MQRTLLRIVWCTFLLFPSLLSLHAEDFWQDTLWIRKLPLGGTTYAKVMFNPDSKSVYATSSQYLFEYDVIKGEILKTRATNSGLSIADYELTSDNKYFIIGTNASGSTGKSVIEIWSVDLGYVRTIPLEFMCISIALSPDDKYVYVGYEEHFVEKFSLESGLKVKSTDKAGGQVNVSPDGQEVVSTFGYPDSKTYLLDATTLEYKKSIVTVGKTSYDKTGRYIAGGGAKNIVYLYDREENQSYPLVSHKEALHDVCFTSDGKYIVSAGYGDSDTPEKGGYRIWSVETKQKIYEAPYYTSTSGNIAISSGNNYYAKVGLGDGVILSLWKFKNPLVGSTDNPTQNNPTLTITPNPTHSFIQITFPIGTSSGDYTISDINGKNILHGNLTNDAVQSGKTMVDVSSLHNGRYTCTVKVGTLSYSSSFIINR